ncbi:MAG: peptidylprolyl isomerase [Clostridia bacterium]|nr:peptidylprolyl isomerase [Clostridia bacterium]
MKKMVRALSLLMGLVLCLMPVMGAMAEAADAAVTNENDVMLTVNGVEVTRGEANEIYQNMLSFYSGNGLDVSSQEIQDIIWALALKQAVLLELINQKAAAAGLDQFTEEENAAMKAQAAEEMEAYVQQYIMYYGNLAEDATEEQKLAVRTDALSYLESMGITEAALLKDLVEQTVYERVQASVTQGVVVEDAEVEAAFAERVSADQAMFADVATYEFYTAYYGYQSYYMPEGYRGVNHILLNVDEAVLADYQDKQAKLEEQASDEGAEATEGTAAADAAAAPEAPVTEEEVEAARLACIANVQPIIDEINEKLAAGASFEDLIVEYGQDPGMKDDTKRAEGYAVAQDSIMWDPAFVKAAFSVDNVGDVAEPVVGSYGVHIVKYVRDVPAGPVEMTQEIQDELRAEVLATKESDMFNNALTQWETEADIQLSDEAAEAYKLLEGETEDAPADEAPADEETPAAAE